MRIDGYNNLFVHNTENNSNTSATSSSATAMATKPVHNETAKPGVNVSASMRRMETSVQSIMMKNRISNANLAQTAAAPPAHLTYNGGKILTHPKVVNIYLGSYWNSTTQGKKDAAHQNAFAKDIVKNNSYTSVWAQYGVGKGSFGGSDVVKTTTHPKVVGEDQIRNIVKQQLAADKVVKSDGQTIYTVYLPPGTVLKTADGTSSLEGLGGYHGSFKGADGKPVYYAAIVYGKGKNGIDFNGNPEDAASIVASHEWTEAATDPDVDDVINGAPQQGHLGWYDDSNGEIGDIAINLSTDPKLRDVWGRLDGFATQKEWSNVDGRTELGAKHPGPVVKPHAKA
jgi:hypothetical protein